MLALKNLIMQHRAMSSVIGFFVSLSFAWGFQILQKSNDVTVVSEGENLREITVSEGNIKFTKDGNGFDLLANTKMSFTENRLQLAKGEFRIRGQKIESFKVETPVGTMTLNGGDFVVQYWSDKAIAMVQVLAGQALIQGLYREEVLNVQKGERGQFVGVPEAGGPAYDVLLKGRKSIRGTVSGPDKLSDDKLKEIDQMFDIKLRPVVKKEKPKPKPGQICSAPFAKYAECVWRCRNNPVGKKECHPESAKVQCIRQKCLANGQWGDTTELKGTAKQECKWAQDEVASCSY